MTRGERAVAFIEEYCKIPEGKHVGKPVQLAPFQKKFIIEVYDNPNGTDTAILSIARKNGKSALIACIVLLHLVGTEALKNTQIISGAMSREQAKVVYNLVVKMIMLDERLKGITKVTRKTITGMYMNVQYEAIAAEAKTAMGLSPVVGIIDECGQIVGSRSAFVESIETAQGAHEKPIMFYISTQAANDSDLLSIMIDDYRENEAEKTVCHVYEADEGGGVMDKEQWAKANPALGIFRSESDMLKLAEKAERMPSAENGFRNLNLNQRVSMHSPFISKTAWQDCEAPPCPIEECDDIYGGLDLSMRTDLTAFVLYGHKDGVWNVYPYFWTPEKGLKDRADRDRAPYDVWVNQGFMRTTSGATVDYEFVAKEIYEITEDLNISAIAYDRWRIDLLQSEFEKIGLLLPLEPWGQGYKDMSPALDSLEAVILNKQLAHGGHPVLTMCAQNTIVIQDPSGNRKADKSKTSGRIDGMVALAMAAGAADRDFEAMGDLDAFISSPLVL